ncbi:MAG: hypothetical protein ACD_7C00265G0008 [uncultured bacterium]|nr:MAG: hypothetical protein ACD_7C00265G0008 [uncultured bacterium]
MKNKLLIFEGGKIRSHWDEDRELWFFSIADVVSVLTGSVDPLAYWRKLKERLLKEGGNETVTKCHGLKMIAKDGKMRFTDVGGTVAGNARKEIESKTGKKVISPKRFAEQRRKKELE